MNNGFLTDGLVNVVSRRANGYATASTPTASKPIYAIDYPGITFSGTPALWGSGSPVMLGINMHAQASGNAIEVMQGGNTSRFSVGFNGNTTANALISINDTRTGAAGAFYWLTRSTFRSPSNGVITLLNAAETDFTRLNFGGTTSSFPALTRSGTSLIQQLADGTAGGGLTVSLPLAKVGGCLEEFFTDAATPASTTETDLYSFTTIANTFSNNGDKIVARFGGSYTSNATSVEIKVYFGGSQIFTTGLHGMAATEHWDIDVLLIRVSSGTVRCITKWIWSASSVSECTYSEVTGLTLSSTNILKITGQSNTGPASGDITAKLGYINWYPVG